jgi:hypothetical protein
MVHKADGLPARGGGPPGGAGAAPGTPALVTRAQRWLARLAFAAALAAVVLLLLSGALKSVTALLLGFAGMAVICAAAWWFRLTAASCAGWLPRSWSPRRWPLSSCTSPPGCCGRSPSASCSRQRP